jgi:hypothetical protein
VHHGTVEADAGRSSLHVRASRQGGHATLGVVGEQFLEPFRRAGDDRLAATHHDRALQQRGVRRDGVEHLLVAGIVAFASAIAALLLIRAKDAVGVSS